MTNRIATKVYRAPQAGRHLLVLGAIHGDEVCGPAAIERVITELDNGSLQLVAGELTLIPVCNARAYAQNVRYTEENLNRIFTRHDHPTSYEAMLANALVPYVDACDILLDIHSFQAEGLPFVFEDAVQMRAFAQAMNFPLVMSGWAELYADNKDKNQGDTIAYALQQCKEAVLVECGQHTDPQAVTLAYQSIINALAYAGLIDKPLLKVRNTSFVHMTQVQFKEKAGTLTRKWRHGDEVVKGEVLAIYTDGESILAPENGFILLPKEQTSIGNEWFYFGREEGFGG